MLPFHLKRGEGYLLSGMVIFVGLDMGPIEAAAQRTPAIPF